MSFYRMNCLRLLAAFILWTGLAPVQEVRGLPSGFREEGVARVPLLSTITFAPKRDGGYFLYVAVKDGQVQVVPDPDDNSERIWTALDIADRVCFNGERGIHQVLVHPDFPNTPRVYISYTFDKNGDCGMDPVTGAVNRLSRFEVNEDYSIDETSEEVLLETSPLFNKVHNGGDMFFGNDGYLYLTIGEGGYSPNSQDRSNLLGTIVRLTEDGDIPPDNPFLGAGTARCNRSAQPGSICQEIYHYGFRNPYRFSLDPNTNDGSTQFYIGDVGGTKWEEISLGGTNFAGGNFGWNTREGPCLSNSYTSCRDSGSDVIDPIFWYGHDWEGGGAAVTGIEVVPNGLWPGNYDGAILYLEFVQNQLYVLTNDGTPCDSCDDGRPLPSLKQTLFHNLEDSNVGRAAQLIFGPYRDTQALYYTTRSGSVNIRRIIFEGTVNRAPIARISVSEASVQVGIPIEFDGTGSSDPDGDDLEYFWDFNDGETSTLPSPSHAYASSGGFEVTLRITDSGGFTGTAEVIVSVGTPPTPIILTPSEGTKFTVGEMFTLIGSAIDSNGDTLPDSSLSWEVRQHHNTHFHPFLDDTTGNGIELDPAPSPEDFLAALESHLEVILTATDSIGVSATTSIILMPELTELSLESDPPGMELYVDNYSVVTPVSVASWVNHPLSLRIMDQDDLYFQKWSDGGKLDHVVVVQPGGQSYVAMFDSCKPLWRIECDDHTECCSGVCINNQCRLIDRSNNDDKKKAHRLSLGGIGGYRPHHFRRGL